MAMHLKKEQYDVVVVGGGLAGVCAAISAARHGSKTAIVQSRSVFGGNASSEVRMHIVGAGCHMAKSNLSESGILMELLLCNKARNPMQSFSIWDGVLWEKVRFQENLDCYLNTNMDDIVMKNGEITSIICHQSTTETRFEIEAKIFIDATGHGTLGTMAGAEYRIGSESRSEFDEPNAPEEASDSTMGNTLMFHAVNMNKPTPFTKPSWAYSFSEEDLKYRHHYNCTSAFSDGGTFTEFTDGEAENLPEFSTMDSGYWWIELGGQYDDIIAQSEDIRDELLKCVYGVWDHIKNCSDHGAANYALDWVGMVPGTRESRRLVGDYLLTENDVRANRIFDDAVAYGGWPMDEHVRGGIMDFDKYPSRIFNFSGSYSIPYRCFYSKNIPNLMMAGRNISTTKMAFGTTRVMGTCAVGGQAAGTAAALAIKHDCTPREIGGRIDELQQALLKDHCYIPGFKNTDSADMALSAEITASSSIAGCEPQLVINGIARMVGDAANCWESEPLEGDSASISLQLPALKKISELRITFDPNLTREIMPSLTSTVRERQVEGMPEELVKDFCVTFYRGGKPVYLQEVRDNIDCLWIQKLPSSVDADSVTVEVQSTYGYPSARIFEIRLY